MSEGRQFNRSGGNRPSHRPRRGGGGGGSRPQRGGGGGGGGRGGAPKKPPMFLGEPSPALAKIHGMNIVQLEAKLATTETEITRVLAKLERMKNNDPPPIDRIETVTQLLKRLQALKTITKKRLGEKLERKAAWEAKNS